MKNKILLLFLCICIGYSFIGCTTQTPDFSLTQSENSEKVINSSSKKKEIREQKKKEIWEDAKSSSIESRIEDYRLENRWEKSQDPYTNFNDFVSAFEEIYNENKFAKKLVDKARNVPYNEWDINTQLVFDTYIKALFAKDEEIYHYSSLGNIEEAWYGHYDGDTDLICISFTNFPISHDDEFKYSYIYILRNSDGHVSGKIGGFKDSIKEVGCIVWTFVEANDIGVDRLNEIIESNKNFIDFLVKYRNDIYSDIVKEEIDIEKDIENTENAKQDRIEELSEMIPGIGMTREEVQHTEWGYPDDINKDTYSWGTTEQWVYDGKGYVYFEDGIVTSVSER